MPDQQGLLFLPTGTIVITGLILFVGTGLLCWMAWSRSGYRTAIGCLELLRFVLVGLIVLTLYQPEWLTIQPADQNSTVAILWDQSYSMQTQDVIENEGGSESIISRAERIKPFLTEEVWTETDSDLTIIFESFSSNITPATMATDLHSGLAQLLENHNSLRGVVILSDGDWNIGEPPVEVAAKYRMKDIPVFAVGIGSNEPLPDLEIASLDVPTFGVANKPLRIPFVIRSMLGQDREAMIQLRVNNIPTVTKPIRIPAMEQSQHNVIWTPSTTGEFTLSLTLPLDPQEILSSNNELTAPISIREEQLQVLVIETYPRWEYRYLRNALERDPGVEVSCLLFHPDLSTVGGGRSYIKEFPSYSELSQFDVVFLGDVGIGQRQLTNEQARQLKQLVRAQASGLVFIPGRTGKQETLTMGPLSDLYPVVFNPEKPQGSGSLFPGQFSLTESGQRSLLTRLENTDSANASVWRTLPGFHWFASVLRAKTGSEILAVHDQESNQFGRIPLIVTKTYGTGKVLFMGTDSAWRWRRGVEDKYHYRFWGQVARWMAYQRNMAQGQSIRLFYSPDRPQVDDVVTLNANVLDNTGGPMSQGTVIVQAIPPSGQTKSIRLQPGDADAWGLFVNSFVPKEPGNYKLIASSAETGATVQTDVTVQGLDRERIGQLARYEVLDEIAQITEGRMVVVSEVKQVLNDLANLPEPEPTVHRIRLWSHPAWGGFLILLLGLFWIGRKVIGVV